ncbi:MAG: hypothetical protein AAF694_21605 [Bacteroidota bacterium]
MKEVLLDYLEIAGEGYYKISNSDAMRPFFMSIVSDSNHWLFVSSNGGLTAGRKDSANALFPYYTDDKITESVEHTGSKCICIVGNEENRKIWEPFSDTYKGVYSYTRNLYKSEYGNKIIFEEVNHDLGLTYQCHWNASNTFGFVRKSCLINQNDWPVVVKLLDGIQNIMPYGVVPELQQASSNLVDAYKKSELLPESQLGIFTLSAIIVDRAEPSESLKANVVWTLGLDQPTVLLSALQVEAFRLTGKVRQEEDMRAERGAYFTVTDISLFPKEQKEWLLMADVTKGPSDVVNLAERILKEEDLKEKVLGDIELGTQNLLALTTAADGKQLSSDRRRNTRHYANVLFNIMRGGIFDDNYHIEKGDFSQYIAKANKQVFETHKESLARLPDIIALGTLKKMAWQESDRNFGRLCLEYLPLKFSRRHGDPSRPWNRFSINTRSEVNGSKILDYQGNWRDIFQNWEALAHSYPGFMENMIHKFLNATTFDGYNPYRVTKDGFDWETIEPDDPWSYIGYWGDHQIIYLLKFLEFIEKHYPGTLERYMDIDFFVYAHVPYLIKPYKEILKNPKDTIEFREEEDVRIRQRRDQLGADGALLTHPSGEIYRVTLIEKLLATLLSKCSNLIPEGGIWMNTQRPEWNDANNALVGNGVSMVTLYYMRRFMTFFQDLVSNSSTREFSSSQELYTFFRAILSTLEENKHLLVGSISDRDRKIVMDGLGAAAGTFRTHIYEQGFSSQKHSISKGELLQFAENTTSFLNHSIEANKRSDHLYHAYNLMTVENEQEVSISYLSEMLEGQVAVLSSGHLSSQESLSLLDGLKNSKLFRKDQYSYLLYPNKELPRFTERNNIPKEAVEQSLLLQQLLKDGNKQVIEQDTTGAYHFNGNFNNADSLKAALESLGGAYVERVEKEQGQLLQVFEAVFNHKAFTGRSGTFYGYEGLGSIYWHMVSKLLLAVQECCVKAIVDQEGAETIGRLLEHYYEIRAGIGVHKSPELYGAFPTDPYSHTPGGKGAQQPGMTGQVKEDILSRWGELGVFVSEGSISFSIDLLLKEEFLREAASFNFTDVNGQAQMIELKENELCFTYCQVPIIYQLTNSEGITIKLANGEEEKLSGLQLGKKFSNMLFTRSGTIDAIYVRFHT